jgi:putative transcriptional regulator
MPTKTKISRQDKRTTSSRVLEAVHDAARDLHNAGFIDKRRMREYDALCLPPIADYSSKKSGL